MKKYLCACLAALLLFCACDDGKKDVLGIVPSYNGAPVTTTDHEFSKDDFIVIASYADGRDDIISDYEFEGVGLKEGYFIIEFTYGKAGNPLYVKCDVPVYPSDLAE